MDFNNIATKVVTGSIDIDPRRFLVFDSTQLKQRLVEPGKPRKAD